MHIQRHIGLLSLFAGLLGILGGCIHEGTLVTVETDPGAHPRAADQAILSEAIEMAFANVDIGQLALPAELMETAPITAYVEVTSPFAMAAETEAYIRDHAGLVAGRLGINVREVRETLQRPNPERLLEVVQTQYPDVSARVLIMVSKAGVDEVYTEDDVDSHGSTEPSRVLLGRFKAVIAITPRLAPFVATSQSLEGRTTYPLSRGNFVDGR